MTRCDFEYFYYCVIETLTNHFIEEYFNFNKIKNIFYEEYMNQKIMLH